MLSRMYMLDFIVMQMHRGNHENSYYKKKNTKLKYNNLQKGITTGEKS